MTVEDTLRSDLLAAGRALSASQLMPGSQGNLSARDPASRFVVITPHDVPYEAMGVGDLVTVELDGKCRSGHREPSYELEVHLAVYRRRPDVFCVIHTEPPFATAFAVVGQEIEAVTTTGLKSARGAVPVTDFTYKRDEAFANRMLEIMGDRAAALWANHGLLVIGQTVHQAVERTYGVEFNARVLYLARNLGGPKTLSFVEDIGMVVS